MREELANKDRTLDQMNDIHLKGVTEMDSLRDELEVNRVLAANLQKLINQWRRDSKQTRDWTKANQLISELEKIL